MTLILRRCCNISCNNRRFSSTSTIDQQEIEQFQRLTSEWWDEFGPTRGLHSMNRLRVPLIRDGLINDGVVDKENVETPQPLKGLSILDVGCGGGILSEALARLGANVTGLDANPDIIKLAKSHAQNNKISVNYLFSSVEHHCKEHGGKYDAVAASEVLEHVTEKEKFIEACAACLKSSGSMFVTTLNKTRLTSILGIYVTENLINLVPKGTHQIEKCIEPHRLQRMLEDSKLTTKLIHGMFYNILTNRWHWCSDTSINYCLHAVKMPNDSD